MATKRWVIQRKREMRRNLVDAILSVFNEVTTRYEFSSEDMAGEVADRITVPLALVGGGGLDAIRKQLSDIIHQVHDFDQCGPCDDHRFEQVGDDLGELWRSIVALARTPPQKPLCPYYCEPSHVVGEKCDCPCHEQQPQGDGRAVKIVEAAIQWWCANDDTIDEACETLTKAVETMVLDPSYLPRDPGAPAGKA